MLLVAIPGIRAYPWLTGEALFVAGLLITRRHPRWGALVLLLASVTRLELVVPSVVLLGTMSALEKRRRREWLQGTAILGLGVGLLLGLLTLFTAGAAFDQLTVDAFIRIPPGRSLPFRPLAIPFPILPLEIVTLVGPIFACIAGLLKRRPYIAASRSRTEGTSAWPPPPGSHTTIGKYCSIFRGMAASRSESMSRRLIFDTRCGT
jgi:hypothetical protein